MEITKLSERAGTEMNAREQQIADSAQRWRAQGCCDRANTEMQRMDALDLKFSGQKTGAKFFFPRFFRQMWTELRKNK